MSGVRLGARTVGLLLVAGLVVIGALFAQAGGEFPQSVTLLSAVAAILVAGAILVVGSDR